MIGVVNRRDTCRLGGGSHFELLLQLAPAAIVDDYIPGDGLGKSNRNIPWTSFCVAVVAMPSRST